MSFNAVVAQLVEHITRNDGVTGSTPVNGLIFQNSEVFGVEIFTEPALEFERPLHRTELRKGGQIFVRPDFF